MPDSCRTLARFSPRSVLSLPFDAAAPKRVLRARYLVPGAAKYAPDSVRPCKQRLICVSAYGGKPLGIGLFSDPQTQSRIGRYRRSSHHLLSHKCAMSLSCC
jgi:hypothetical protein